MLIQYGLVDRSLMSFLGFDRAKTAGRQPRVGLQLLSRDPRRRFLVPAGEILFARLPLRVDAVIEQDIGLASKPSLQPYVETIARLVTETPVAGGVLRITEKSMKPVGLGLLRFVYGSPGAVSPLEHFCFDVLRGLNSQDSHRADDGFERPGSTCSTLSLPSMPYCAGRRRPWVRRPASRCVPASNGRMVAFSRDIATTMPGRFSHGCRVGSIARVPSEIDHCLA